MTPLLVALGGGLGALLRFLVSHRLDDGFPRGTLLVNTLGSFLLGACSGLGLSGHPLAFIGVGLCGGLTTYSAFAVQASELGRLRGTWYVVASLVLALGACALGFGLAAQA